MGYLSIYPILSYPIYLLQLGSTKIVLITCSFWPNGMIPTGGFLADGVSFFSTNYSLDPEYIPLENLLFTAFCVRNFKQS